MNYSKDIRSLLVEQLKELVFSNQIVAEALPQIQLKVTNASYSKLVFEILNSQGAQWKRLVTVFQMLNEGLGSEDCIHMSNMVKVPQTLADLATDPEQVDNNLLLHLMRMEQFQMAGYGASAVYADTLGFSGVSELLGSSLLEKREISKRIRAYLNESNLVENNFYG